MSKASPEKKKAFTVPRSDMSVEELIETYRKGSINLSNLYYSCVSLIREGYDQKSIESELTEKLNSAELFSLLAVQESQITY